MKTPASDPKQKSTAPSCFVIMPISDVDPYPIGHFRRVYDHLVRPACELAGFQPTLASDVKETNMIVLDVLERLHNAEMVLCDLSARNPNVLYELGFRQAFNKPVTLIKDTVTERIFDISGLRDIPYDHSLRIDAAQIAVAEIAERMRATYEAAKSKGGGVNSLVQLLSIDPATLPQRNEISDETRLILNAIRGLGDRVGSLEAKSERRTVSPKFSSDDSLGSSRVTVEFESNGVDVDVLLAELRDIPAILRASDLAVVRPGVYRLDLIINNSISRALFDNFIAGTLQGLGCTLLFTHWS